MKLEPAGGAGPAVMFIIRGASLVQAVYASENMFPTEWHLDGVRLASLDAEQLSPAPQPLLLTLRHSRVAQLRLPALGPGARLTLENCTVAEIDGNPERAQLRPPEPAPGARPELVVRMSRIHLLRAAAFSLSDGGTESRPSLLIDDCEIGEMEQASVSLPHSSCQLTFTNNAVGLLQREVFSLAGGSLRITNNTFGVPHAAAFLGFCGQLIFNDNDVRGPLVFGALHFERCVHYSQHGNSFQCPCDSVGWLAMFEERQRTSAVEVFYERLYKASLCRTDAGAVPMTEFAAREDCSGRHRQANLMLGIVALVVVVLLLTLLVAVRLCRRRSGTKLHPPRPRRARNLYSSDISAPIPKTSSLAAASPRLPPHAASLSHLAAADGRPLGHYVTCESDDEDGLYATIVFKKRRAPDPPESSTPGRRRAAPRVLNRCISEGGLRLPAYRAAPLGSGRVRPAPEERAPQPDQAGIVEEPEDPYLVPDGAASDYVELTTALYEEISAAAPAREATGAVTARLNGPHAHKTSQKDSGIGDDFCPEGAPPADSLAGLGSDVYSPPIRPRRPALASPQS
ncbi:uncharacterized protein LOC119101798 [Pollicipes pollicipes]|uniref:uncharacterized protein LOC119101798 n=1 Tax=Pollicipes pollicipes TaxID=41117 RepID=UPI00188499EA|nr:uncharacterized protein LOC119101798 [Pollicipes pollicipes]